MGRYCNVLPFIVICPHTYFLVEFPVLHRNTPHYTSKIGCECSIMLTLKSEMKSDFILKMSLHSQDKNSRSLASLPIDWWSSSSVYILTDWLISIWLLLLLWVSSGLHWHIAYLLDHNRLKYLRLRHDANEEIWGNQKQSRPLPLL